MREKLYQLFTEEEQSKLSAERKEQKGSGNLGDKIRTYNWPANRITDHRIGEQKFGLDAMFSGQLLQEFIELLIQDEREKHINAFLKGAQ